MKQLFSRLFLGGVAAMMVWSLSASGAAAAARPDYRYVALGDSVAAGLGLPPASTANQLCGRSAAAYPQQIANYYQIAVDNLACSGAKADEGLYGQQERAGYELTPQLDAAFAGGTPDLMTATIGANDARWSHFIRDCYLFRCDSSWDDFRAKAYLADLRYELDRTLREVEQRSNGQPPLVALSGYYQPFPDGDCATGITTDELTWLDRYTDELNSVIENAASDYSFAAFVPLDFSGHGACATDPWIQGNNDPAPFHPTVAGQQAISEAFINAFRQNY